MKKEPLLNYWKNFIHWNGWKRFAHWKGWEQIAHWHGWKKLFVLPPALLTLAVLVSASGLIWVFLNHMDQSLPAYVLYPVSAYTLIAVCFSLPPLLKQGNLLLHKNPAADRLLNDSALRLTLGLYMEEIINFFYGIFKIVMGFVIGSAWIGADGIYNFAQAIIQLVQIIRRRKQPTLVQQWQSYRLCGWLTLGMHLTLTGLVFQMINWGRAEEYPGFLIFATAAFVFYKLISSFIDVAKDRKHKAPVDSAIRLMNLSQAFFSMFSLQASLLHAFGQEFLHTQLLNTLTGCTVCLLVAGMGIYMIRRGNRNLRILQK